jgi:hypothetical protein
MKLKNVKVVVCGAGGSSPDMFHWKIGTQLTVDELGSSHQSVISFRSYVCSVRYAGAADRSLVRRSVPVAASHIKRRYDV